MADFISTTQTSGAGVAGSVQLAGNYGHRDVARNGLTKALAAFDIDFAVNATNFASTELGAGGAVKEVLATVATMGVIVGTSAIRADSGANAGQIITVLVEGDFGTDTYDGTNSESLATHLQDLIRAKTSVGAGPVNLNAATVAAVAGFPMAAV
jgi:hypothetical protein